MSEDEKKRVHRGSRTIDLPTRSLQLEQTSMPLDMLHLDASNVRLHNELMRSEMKGEVLTEEKLEKMLREKDGTKKLYRSIGASGGLSTALIVTSQGLTVEGNERVVAMRLIKDDLNKDKKKGEKRYTKEMTSRLESLLENIPVDILPPDTTKTERDIIVGRIHNGGNDEWSPFAQAANIYELAEVDGLEPDEIAKQMPMSKSLVYQRLKGYRLMVQYLKKYPSSSPEDYSYFEELYKVSAKLKKAGFDVERGENLDAFFKIVALKQLPWAIDVRKMPKILENEETRSLFFNGDARGALEILPEFDPSQFSPRLASIVKVKNQLPKIDREDLEIIGENERYQDLINGVIKELQKVLRQATGGGSK